MLNPRMHPMFILRYENLDKRVRIFHINVPSIFLSSCDIIFVVGDFIMGEYTCTLPQKVYYDNELPILTRPSFRKRFHEYFNASICTAVVLEAELLVLSFITGIEDIAAFNDFHVFTSNHTGNTILLGVGASGIASSFTALPYVGISFSMFILGCWIFGRLGNSVGCRKRWWMIATNVFQTVLVFAAAGLRSWGTFSETLQGYQLPPTATSLGVLVLLAISSGAQVAMARSLQVVEITTANATSVYVDLFMDRNLFRLHNRARNRRALFVLSLSAGSCAGAFAYRNVGAANTLLITALGKVAVTLAMFYNKGFAYEERKGKL